MTHPIGTHLSSFNLHQISFYLFRVDQFAPSRSHFDEELVTTPATGSAVPRQVPSLMLPLQSHLTQGHTPSRATHIQRLMHTAL